MGKDFKVCKFISADFILLFLIVSYLSLSGCILFTAFILNADKLQLRDHPALQFFEEHATEHAGGFGGLPIVIALLQIFLFISANKNVFIIAAGFSLLMIGVAGGSAYFTLFLQPFFFYSIASVVISVISFFSMVILMVVSGKQSQSPTSTAAKPADSTGPAGAAPPTSGTVSETPPVNQTQTTTPASTTK